MSRYCLQTNRPGNNRLLPYMMIIFAAAVLHPQRKVEAQTEKGQTPMHLEELPADATASDILARMALAYSECQSYRDRGEVHSVLDSGASKTETKQRFSTTFIRPDRFKYEFRVKPWYGGGEQLYVVWGNGQGFKSWWTVRPQVEQFSTISEAIAGPTGISQGSAYTVPTLLLGTRRTHEPLLGEGRPERLDDEIINGVDCYVLRGTGEWEDETTVWIDKGSLGLRKIYESKTFSKERLEKLNESTKSVMGEDGVPPEHRPIREFSGVTTTTYSPHFEISVNPSFFTFDPPTTEEPSEEE